VVGRAEGANCRRDAGAWGSGIRSSAALVATLPKASTAPLRDFVPIVEAAPRLMAPARKAASAPLIEVQLEGAVVRVSELGDGAAFTAVLRAIRASAAKE
jgi:hypothetical protein